MSAREVYDPVEAAARAEQFADDPKVKAWLRRAARLFRDIPAGTTIYYQEDTMNLMALSATSDRYTQADGEGSDTAAVIGAVRVPGSDCGGW